jgi:hypothetical protein
MADQPRPIFDIAELLAAARAETGQEDLADEGSIDGLQRYLEAVADEGDLTPAGVAGVRADTVRLLANRLRMEALVRAHPEILDEDVSDPIIITGLPRTGTTKLQRVLSAHLGVQQLPLWKALNPAPFGDPNPDPDPRITVAEEQSALMMQHFPDFVAAHPMSAHEPEEDALLQQLTFRSIAHGLFNRVPSYMDWVMAADRAPTYEGERRALQLLQWQDGGRQDRPWVLKTPVHLGALDTLFATFPNATVVHCHRDLDEAIPSFCRLIEVVRLARGSASVDCLELGRFLSEWCGELWARNIAQRDGLNEAQILDVRYETIRDDVASIIAAIYDRRGESLGQEALNSMAEWERHNPPHRFGKHVYSLERYGLTPVTIDKALSAYLDHFAAEAR